MNAANEVAVCAYLEGKTGFLDMPRIIQYTMDAAAFSKAISIESLEESDMTSRKIATDYIYKNR
jgi:1-deoxy-D-xylulose-5-phosphate reductoisomerase